MRINAIQGAGEVDGRAVIGALLLYVDQAAGLTPTSTETAVVESEGGDARGGEPGGESGQGGAADGADAMGEHHAWVRS